MSAEWTERGGMQIGYNRLLCFNASWPFATMTISDVEITLSTLWLKRVFSKTEIAGLSTYRGFISDGIRIRSHHPHTAKHIIYWSRNQKQLISALKKRGYVFTD